MFVHSGRYTFFSLWAGGCFSCSGGGRPRGKKTDEKNCLLYVPFRSGELMWGFG